MMIRLSIISMVCVLLVGVNLDASKRRERRAIHYASAHAMSNGCAAQVQSLSEQRMQGRSTVGDMEMQQEEIHAETPQKMHSRNDNNQASSHKPMDEMTEEMHHKIMENKKSRNHACNGTCTYQDHQMAALELSQQAREMQKKALDFQRQALQHRRQINEAHEQMKQAQELAYIHKEAELKMQQEALHFIKLSKNIEKQSVEHLESMSSSHSQA